jgi:hypothetical protein
MELYLQNIRIDSITDMVSKKTFKLGDELHHHGIQGKIVRFEVEEGNKRLKVFAVTQVGREAIEKL